MSRIRSVLALCEMFLSGNPSLRNMQVKGEQIIKPELANGSGNLFKAHSPSSYLSFIVNTHVSMLVLLQSS